MKILTDKDTIKAIKDITAEMQDQPKNIRLYVAGFSCSGPSFGLALDEIQEGDLSYEEEDVTFLMEEALYDQFGDIKVESMICRKTACFCKLFSFFALLLSFP